MAKSNSVILIPVKNLVQAKQRLAAVLDQPARSELAQAMLADVLDCLGGWSNRPEVNLVTSDPFALDLAHSFGFDAIADNHNRSETDAIEAATQVCLARGAESTLVIPADIALIRADELDEIFCAAPVEGSVLVPAADGRGTNAAYRRPAGLFPLRFGNDSFKPHLAAAKATEKPCIVLTLSGIALDVDSPADLHQLASRPGDTRSQRLARQWGFADFVQAASD